MKSILRIAQHNSNCLVVQIGDKLSSSVSTIEGPREFVSFVCWAWSIRKVYANMRFLILLSFLAGLLSGFIMAGVALHINRL